MFGNNRIEIRRVFTEAWRKHRANVEASPLEALISSIIEQHPEYQQLIEKPDAALDRDFLPEGGETNPFLHMGMHITLQEQISTDRPPGISALYQRLVKTVGDAHEAEHRLMECLGRMLWEAQSAGTMPDEHSYLECVQQLIPGWNRN
ncbi:MAG: DUF1841 family protein [Gammaproteobacteria bacterium]|nr:DUF1841 family protein [Gammaproteobacteria bacterium]MCP5407325.1 DUF1841 family protein [Chromatiaceae bacterium]MCP5409044.1 DUF1841 family protein [Chromatiaceae bacterium]MCP5441935.1 DUF1841 family protein [Chromatiaceae bacterium]